MLIFKSICMNGRHCNSCPMKTTFSFLPCVERRGKCWKKRTFTCFFSLTPEMPFCNGSIPVYVILGKDNSPKVMCYIVNKFWMKDKKESWIIGTLLWPLKILFLLFSCELRSFPIVKRTFISMALSWILISLKEKQRKDFLCIEKNLSWLNIRWFEKDVTAENRSWIFYTLSCHLEIYIYIWKFS